MFLFAVHIVSLTTCVLAHRRGHPVRKVVLLSAQESSEPDFEDLFSHDGEEGGEGEASVQVAAHVTHELPTSWFESMRARCSNARDVQFTSLPVGIYDFGMLMNTRASFIKTATYPCQGRSFTSLETSAHNLSHMFMYLVCPPL